MREKVNLEISVWTIAKIILVLAAIYLLYYIRDIILLLFVVFIFVSTFNPVVERWEKKIKRIPAVLILALIGIGILAFVVYVAVPPIVTQFSQFISNLPDILTKYPIIRSDNSMVKEALSSVSSNISGITGSIFNLTAGVFGGIFALFTAIVISIYLLIDRNGVTKLFKFLPAEKQEEVSDFSRKVSDKIGNWFRGQIVLCATVGIIDLVGLLIIGVPYALTIAVISGILELVPIVGPVASGAIAAILALTVSPVKAIIIIAFYILVQQLENSILVPKIMQRAVGLSPVIIITAVLIGGKLLGIAGALLAVPIAATIAVVVQEWPNIKNIFSKDA